MPVNYKCQNKFNNSSLIALKESSPKSEKTSNSKRIEGTNPPKRILKVKVKKTRMMNIKIKANTKKNITVNIKNRNFKN